MVTCVHGLRLLLRFVVREPRRGREPEYFELHEIAANFDRFLTHARAADVPDVIAFADLAHDRGRYVRALARRQLEPDAPGACLPFPFPNGPAKLRRLSVIDPRGQVLLRCAAGRIASTTDPRLFAGVHSARLVAGPPSWETRSPDKAWQRLKKEGRKFVSSADARAVLRTDVAGYYPSIEHGRLEDLLSEIGCDADAVTVLGRCLAWWRTAFGLVGLPIGPEASGVLGTGFLHPVDELVREHSLGYLRYTDDIFVVGGSADECWDFAASVDSGLSALALTRNIEKTEVIDADEARVRWFGRNPIGPYDDAVDGGVALTEVGAVQIVRGELARGDPDPDRFRYALGALRTSKNREVVVELLASPAALELFPKQVGDYLLDVAPLGAELVERTLDGLADPLDDRHHARDVHLIRACRGERLGRVEGQGLVHAAMDSRRPSPVRAWALDACARAGGVRLDELGDIALDPGEDTLVQRAAVAGTRNVVHSARRRFLRHPRLRNSVLGWTASWAASFS